MNLVTKTTTIKGDRQMNSNRQTAVMKESKMKITATNVIRWAGLAAMAAGIIFAGIQPIHPPDFLSSVNTRAWAMIMPLKTAMGLFFLLGITGLYARQVERAGWLGLASYLMLSLSWALQTCFIFAEAFILPPLAAAAPQFVESFLGLAHGSPGADIGALPAIYNVTGLLYIVGGLLFGIATLRARILPRWPAILLVVATALTPAASFVPHPLNRVFAIPMGLAIAWLGYTLWSERREKSSEPVNSTGSPQLRQAGAE
jgi:hypothetical protein